MVAVLLVLCCMVAVPFVVYPTDSKSEPKATLPNLQERLGFLR